MQCQVSISPLSDDGICKIIKKLCKFGNFREGFIFVKLRICKVS